jgi:hypothetical protein
MCWRIAGGPALQLWRSILFGLVGALVGNVGLSVARVGASDNSVPPTSAACDPSPISENAPALILRREPLQDDEAGDREGSPPAIGSGTSSNSSAGLFEEPGATEAGGVKVDLQGRFRTSLVLERRTDGTTIQRCISNLPGAASGDH